MRTLAGLVVGTAGHIDHGKTSLVYALTGIDTDRLKEEKQRGISIDLGFAQMNLQDGRAISFIDVPGHERFVRNMLAGAAGMEAVMLIVAANEGVMPQTQEHFEICCLLGLRHGLVVMTKCDVATPDQIAASKAAIKALVAGSFLAASRVVEVSAITGYGLPELKLRIADMVSLDSSRSSEGVMRMPVDRSFAVKGFGTVVTGTLLAGTVNVGDTLEVYPQRTKVRVRALQTRHETVQQAIAGQRVAINLSGIEQATVKRGHLLTAPDVLSGSGVLDVELRWLQPDALPSTRELFVLHLGTAEVNARVALHRVANEVPKFARLRLTEEVIALPGDRFVIRRPSPAQTVGGGVVVDAFSPRRLSRAKTRARLEALHWVGLIIGDFGKRIEMLVDEQPAGCSIADLVRATGASQAQVREAIAKNDWLAVSADERVVTGKWIDGKQRAVLAWLEKFHKENPNAAGAPLATARLGLNAGLMALILKNFEAVRIQGESIALAAHKAQFTSGELAALQKMEEEFRAGGFQPPALAVVLSAAGVDGKKARALLETLIKNNRLIRLPDGLLFHADVIGHIRSSLTKQKGRRFSVVDFKAWTNVSRKFAIPLLEYLDQQRITKREGETRVVL